VFPMLARNQLDPHCARSTPVLWLIDEGFFIDRFVVRCRALQKLQKQRYLMMRPLIATDNSFSSL
jgi:hypothetical protein